MGQIVDRKIYYGAVWLACVLIALLVAAFVQRLNPLFLFDAKFYDAGITARQAAPPEEIAIVGLTEKFIENRHVSLMPRDRIARLIEILAVAKPAVIAVDVWFDSRVDFGPQGVDETLRRALLQAKKNGVPVLLAQKEVAADDDPLFNQNASSKGTLAHGATLPFFAEAASGVANVDFQTDGDRVVRMMPFEKGTLTLPARAVDEYLKKQKRLSLSLMAVRKEARPIEFTAPPGAMTIHDAAGLLKQPYLAGLFANKIVFIGATFPRSDDLFNTPYQSMGDGVRRLYGVELLAQSAATVLRGASRRSHEIPSAQGRVMVLSLLVAAFIAACALRSLPGGLITLILCSGGALWLAIYTAREPSARFGWHYWPPSPLLAAALTAWMTGAGWRQKIIQGELRRVRDVFGGYVGKEVLNQLGGRMPEMGGETREVAVLFCDIQGFSGLAEKLRDDPAHLLQLLNDHFEPLVAALQTRGAFVDNYVGDLVMAVFGAPISKGSLQADTHAAVLAALDFERIISERNAQHKERGETPIEVGIGVHCGPAVVGNLGSQARMKYTAIGDTVNIASRVESETRHYPTRLLVTEEVIQLCPEWQWEFMAETVVKGRAAPVKLYRPVV
jgi:class 3 adenylate cyclase/CHASE2 domain-containing sensor protein